MFKKNINIKELEMVYGGFAPALPAEEINESDAPTVAYRTDGSYNQNKNYGVYNAIFKDGALWPRK